MYQNRRLDLRLSDPDLITLDKKRGHLTRSKYLRWLIHHGPEPTAPKQVPMYVPEEENR